MGWTLAIPSNSVFSESLVEISGGVVIGDFTLPVTADSLGSSTPVVSGTDITVTLTGAVSTPGGTYAQAVLGQGKPSGIRLSSAAHLRDAVGNAAVTGTTASARDVGEILADLALVWNENGLSAAKTWAIGNMVINSSKTSPTPYAIRNIGAATVVLDIAGTGTASWTLQSAPGPDQFAVVADLGLLGKFALQVPGTMSARLFSGQVHNFALRLSTPTSTSVVGVQQGMTLTITASVY